MSTVEMLGEVLAVSPRAQHTYISEGRYLWLPTVQTASAITAQVRDSIPKFEHTKARVAYGSCLSQVINGGFSDGFTAVKPVEAVTESNIARIIGLSDLVDYATENERLLSGEHLVVAYETGYDAGQLAIGN